MRVMSATGNCGRCAVARGFTLIELLVVMAILVMTAAALPLALDRTLPGRRVSVTAQKVVVAMRDAGSQSVAQGRPITLEFRDRALVSDFGVTVSFPAATRVVLTDADGRPLQRINVYPDGSADSARFEVRERTHVRVVAVSGHTGRVTLEERRRAL
jgi:general secretion pathway protein H